MGDVNLPIATVIVPVTGWEAGIGESEGIGDS